MPHSAQTTQPVFTVQRARPNGDVPPRSLPRLPRPVLPRLRPLFALVCALHACPLGAHAQKPSAGTQETSKAVGQPVTVSRPEWVLSSCDLGAAGQPKMNPADIVRELRADGWPAKVAPAESPAATDWRKIPAGTHPESWVSLVTASFGRRGEVYAFQFQGQDGRAKLLAHISHKMVPGVGQDPMKGAYVWTDASPNVASALRTHREAPPANPETAKSFRPLQLEIVHVQESEAPEVQDTERGSSLDTAMSLPPQKVLPVLDAIITAAACSAGWAPGPGAAPSRARVELRVQDRACAIQVSFVHEGRETHTGFRRIPWEEYPEQLKLLFHWPALEKHVSDFARPHFESLQLLGLDQNKLFCLLGDEVAALDATTAAELWRIRKRPGQALPARLRPQYTTRRDPQGKLRIVRWNIALSEVSPHDGALLPLAAGAASAPHSFDFAGDGALASAEAMQLRVFSKGKEIWTTTEKHEIRCGPRFEKDRVLIGHDGGELLALDRATGKELWRTPAGGSFYGSISAAGALRFAFCAQTETLVAFSPEDGSLKWRFQAGDALAQEPFEFNGSLFLVTKANRVVRLHPESGAVLHEVQWPAWISGLQPVDSAAGTVLALNDSRGRLTLLDARLVTQGSANLETRLTGATFSAVLPEIWRQRASKKKGADEDLSEALTAPAHKPFFLSTNNLGFLLKLTPESLR